jgi:diguanylate cyclase (GGDEF)-like protein
LVTTPERATAPEPSVEGHDAVVEDLARRVRQASAPEGTTDLVDGVTGLLDHRYFTVALERRISAARRKLSPLSLVILELWPEDERQPRISDQSMKVLAAVVRAVLREADTGCRIDDRTIAVILEETPEAGAVWATERVRGGFFATTFRGNVRLAAGIAAYPAHALEPEQLLAAAREAAMRSREGKEQSIEIARVDESAGESGA